MHHLELLILIYSLGTFAIYSLLVVMCRSAVKICDNSLFLFVAALSMYTETPL